MTPQFKLSLDTCPEELFRHYIGDCQTCDRPMAPNRLMKRMPELKKWFMHANNATQCRSCYSHQNDARPAQREYHKKTGPSGPLSPDLVFWLRSEIGACLSCGWLPDEPDDDGTMDSHSDRGCPEAITGQQEPLDEDLRETA